MSLVAVNHLDTYFAEPTGLPTVTSDITVEGGDFVIERDGAAPDFRIFVVAANGTLTLNRVTVRNGSGVYLGGGVNVAIGSTATLTNTTLSGNTTMGYGGGIYNANFGNSLINSTLSGNSALGSGGGIYALQSFTVTNSIVAGNAGFA